MITLMYFYCFLLYPYSLIYRFGKYVYGYLVILYLKRNGSNNNYVFIPFCWNDYSEIQEMHYSYKINIWMCLSLLNSNVYELSMMHKKRWMEMLIINTLHFFCNNQLFLYCGLWFLVFKISHIYLIIFTAV